MSEETKEPRLKVGDLVKTDILRTVKGKKINKKDNGIIIEMKMIRGYSSANVFWQRLQEYIVIGTEFLEKVEFEPMNTLPDIEIENVGFFRKFGE